MNVGRAAGVRGYAEKNGGIHVYVISCMPVGIVWSSLCLFSHSSEFLNSSVFMSFY